MEVTQPLAAYQAVIAARHFRPALEAALGHASETHTFANILDGLREGAFQLWPGARSVIVTQVQEYPQRTVLCVYLAGGVLTELQQMLPAVLAWAKAHGCKAAFLAGREGWARTFLTKTDGWRATQVILEREL